MQSDGIALSGENINFASSNHSTSALIIQPFSLLHLQKYYLNKT